MPASSKYGAAGEKTVLSSAIAKAPWISIKSLTAVSAPVGDDVVSPTTQVILRPSIPPAALISLKRVSIAAAAVPKLDALPPVRSPTIPILIVVGVIPGALALSPAPLALASPTEASPTDTAAIRIGAIDLPIVPPRAGSDDLSECLTNGQGNVNSPAVPRVS